VLSSVTSNLNVYIVYIVYQLSQIVKKGRIVMINLCPGGCSSENGVVIEVLSISFPIDLGSDFNNIHSSLNAKSGLQKRELKIAPPTK
jgi:hypothetical protein